MDFGNLYSDSKKESSKVVNADVLDHHFMKNIKTIAFSEDANNAFGIDAVEAPLMGDKRIDLEHLPLKDVHVYLHGLTQTPLRLQNGYRIKLSYGQIDPDTYLYNED